MKPDDRQEVGRREFFRRAGRWASLAGLAALAAALAERSRRPLGAGLPGGAPGDTCDNRGLCRGCGGFTSCSLPPALSARQALAVR